MERECGNSVAQRESYPIFLICMQLAGLWLAFLSFLKIEACIFVFICGLFFYWM